MRQPWAAGYWVVAGIASLLVILACIFDSDYNNKGDRLWHAAVWLVVTVFLFTLLFAFLVPSGGSSVK